MFELTPFGGMRVFTAYNPYRETEERNQLVSDRQAPAFKTDIRETETAYLIEAELPGFSKEEIRAEIKNGILTISAEHKAESEDSQNAGRYLRRERRYCSYKRSFDLDGIRCADITAAHKDGILTLTLPKEAPAEDTARQIEIG